MRNPDVEAGASFRTKLRDYARGAGDALNLMPQPLVKVRSVNGALRSDWLKVMGDLGRAADRVATDASKKRA